MIELRFYSYPVSRQASRCGIQVFSGSAVTLHCHTVYVTRENADSRCTVSLSYYCETALKQCGEGQTLTYCHISNLHLCKTASATLRALYNFVCMQFTRDSLQK